MLCWQFAFGFIYNYGFARRLSQLCSCMLCALTIEIYEQLTVFQCVLWFLTSTSHNCIYFLR